MRFAKFMPLIVGALVGVAILGAPTPVQATTLTLKVFDDGVEQFGFTVIATSNSLIYSGTTTNFSISNGSGSSNWPGTSSASNLSTSDQAQVSTTFGSGGGTHTIAIWLTQTGFTGPSSPGNPLYLSSSAGGSFAYVGSGGPTASVSSTYNGYADVTNTLFGTTAGTPTQSASASRTTVGTTPLVYTPGTSTATLPSATTPFSMTDVMSFTFTLAAGNDQATVNASASTTATVPEPASLPLVLAGVPLLALAWRLRRRQVA